MKIRSYNILVLLILAVLLATSVNAQVKSPQDSQPVFPKGSKVTNNNFTGTVYLQMLVQGDSLNPASIGNVTFEAKARTKWHFHPSGQTLMVTDGVGYYQEKGQPKKVIRRGDVIKCTPNIPHWHGASNDSGMTHLAMTGNTKGTVVWLEAVTDEEYNK